MENINMRRIDVVAKDNKFAVLVNLGTLGCFQYSTPTQANKEAKALHNKTYPHYTLSEITVK